MWEIPSGQYFANPGKKSKYSNSEIVLEYSNGMRIFKYPLTSLITTIDYYNEIPIFLEQV